MYGISYIIPYIESEDEMKAEDVLKQMTSGDNFYVTYFAKTHNGEPIINGGKIITRKGTWTKPNTNGKTQGKYYVSSKGDDIFVYWDLDAVPNKNGNQWRQAKNPMRVKL